MPFDYLRSYQLFQSIHAMDEAIAGHLTKHDLTPAERSILRRIAQSALKFPGAAHLKATTIASSVAVSTKTVYRAVKRLHALGILRIVSSTKLNGIKGANIYQILHVPSEMSERVEADNMHEDANCPLLSGEETISFNLLKTSKKNNNIYNNLSYFNERQAQLYELMNQLPIADYLQAQLYAAIVSVSITNDCQFILARDVLLRVILDSQVGTLTIHSSLRAVFKAAYEKALARTAVPHIQPNPSMPRPVPFYDWLTIRE